MKILMATDNLIKGGKERRLIELLKGLEQEPEISVELVIFSRKVEYPEIFDLNVNIHYLERKPKKDPRVFWKFYNVCRKTRPDIIHSWGSMPSIYVLPAARLLGIKMINAMIADAPHNMRITDTRLFRGRLTFPFSDAILANSYAGLKAYGAKAEKSYCIHNGFDFRRIAQLEAPDAIRAQLGIETPKIVGMVGAFADRKDYFTYLKAAIRVVAEREDVTFLAIGNGKNLKACKAMVPPEFKDRIVFTGQISNVESVASVFNIGVLISNKTVHGEGISNSILEYMALAKPVIATDCGGTSEILLHEETGFLVDDKDVFSLVRYLNILLDDDDLAEQMGETGAQRVYESFNLSKMTAAYKKLYYEVAKGKSFEPAASVHSTN